MLTRTRRGINQSSWPHVAATRAVLLAAMTLTYLGALTIANQVNADGGAPNLAYVAGGGAGGSDLDVIDMGKRSVSWSVTLDSAPYGVLLSADSREVYVTEPATNRLIFVGARSHHTDTSLTLGAHPTAMALDLSSSPNRLYVAETGTSAVAIVDTNKRSVVATVQVGLHPSGLAVAGASSGIPNPNDAQVYVVNSDSDTVSVIATRERQVVATIPVPGGPIGVVIPNSGGVAYVSTRSGDIVAVDLAHQTLLGAALQTPGDAIGAMDYDAVTGQIYVPDATANAVYALAPVAVRDDTSAPAMSLPHEPARTIPEAGNPAAVAITFDGAYALVAEPESGTVVIMDAVSHETLKRVTVGGAPRAVITGAYPALVSQVAAFIIDMLFIGGILLLPVLFYLSERRYQHKKRQQAAPR